MRSVWRSPRLAFQENRLGNRGNHQTVWSADGTNRVPPRKPMANSIEALRLARHVPVFPCRVDNKRPITDHGFYDASIDPDQIKQWWARYRNALVGVPTGARFIVVDIDLQHPEAQEWFASAELPETRTHFTRSGGRHLLFQPHPQVRNSEGKIWPCVDTRGAGGYIIWWPSEGFEVINAGMLAPVPDWIIRKLNPPAPSPNPAAITIDHASSPILRDHKLRGILRTIVSSQNGIRNSRTFWAACRLAEMVRDNAISYDVAKRLAVDAAIHVGLSRSEAVRSTQSAFRTIGIE
jgi:hypothetical protein